MNLADTIVAVASPPGRSARGIVRLSGPGTFPLLRGRITWSAGKPTRGLHHTHLLVQPSRRPDRGPTPAPQVAALAMVFIGPASYTGEDAVELLLPGNPVLLERIIDMLLADGRERGIDARRAEPGEFTARAFMNGRLSLAAAEGVAATIAARGDAQLRAAQHLGTGRLAEHARMLADDLAGGLALVEAGIDFTDQEDVVPIDAATLFGTLTRLHGAIARLLDRAVGLEALEAVPWVVLTGPPNAGKSTLFNALLGRMRTVVSDVAGTTRDVIAEPLVLGGGEVMLVDLAGSDAGAGALDRAMQSRAREAIDRAELVLECLPVGAPVVRRSAGESTEEVTDPRTTRVRTMADRAEAEEDGTKESVVVSALTGRGIDDLRRLIARRLGDHVVSLAADAVVLQPRHEAALADARDALDAAITLLTPCRDDRDLPEPELIAAAMRGALDALATVAGEITPDDVLGRVFATFCVGK